MWRGPAKMTEPLAVALWFDGAIDFERQLDRLEQSLTTGVALGARDWHRAVAVAELAFASWVLGAAGDWDIVSGMDDHATLDRLRAVQRKVGRVRPWPEPYGRPGHTGKSGHV